MLKTFKQSRQHLNYKNMKQLQHPPLSRIRSFTIRLLAIILSVTGTTAASAQTDPYARLKALANSQDSLTSQESKITVTASNPNWKANSRKAIPFVPIPMQDKNGHAISANDPVKLANGRTIPAGIFFTRLNELKRSLNEKGFNLNQNAVVSQLVTPSATLNGQISKLPKAKGKLRTQAQLDSFLTPAFKVGSTLLLPLGKYASASERTRVQQSVITKTGPGKFTLAPLIYRPAVPVISRLLQTINQTTSRDLHFGSASTFLAGLRVSLNRFAKIYGSDGQHAVGKLSEYRISATGQLYASILNHSFDVLNATGEAYVPSDTSKKMSLKVIMSVVGINIFNIDEEYDQIKSITGEKARNFDKSFAASIPILPFIDFTGKIGIKGMVGYDYSCELDHAFLSAEFKPVADIEGYAEVGISDPYDIGTVGARGTLTFLKGFSDLSGWFGIFNANSAQIVLGYGYNVSYYITFLSGKLEAFYRVCVPDWVPFVGGDCTEDAHTIFSWTGFTVSGTYADDRNLITIYNGPVVKAAAMTQ